MLGIYLTCGYPNLSTTKKALRILDAKGVDLIELGVPFSDPLADGPVIQKASFQALQNGVNLNTIFNLVAELQNEGCNANEKKGLNNIILFSYFNPLFNYGFDRLIEKCLETKIRGVLIADLPIEEAQELSQKFKAAGLDLILLVAVTSSNARIEKISELSEPWIYLVSRTGVTGSQEDIKKLEQKTTNYDERLKEIIQTIKAKSKKKIGLGFGIDSKAKVEHALDLGADMAIIGSKTVKLLEDASLKDFAAFLDELL